MAITPTILDVSGIFYERKNFRCPLTAQNNNNNNNNNYNILIVTILFKPTNCIMITSIVRMDDHKLSQEMNLTVQQPCNDARRHPIMSYI